MKADVTAVNKDTFRGAIMATNIITNRLLRHQASTIEVAQEEDWTIVPVKVTSEDTIKVIETGIVVEEYTLCFDHDFDESDEYRELNHNRGMECEE